MNSQRLTISMPQYIYKQLVKAVPVRTVSKFISTVVEEKLLQRRKDKSAVEAFFSMRRNVPKKSLRGVLSAIAKGRQ